MTITGCIVTYNNADCIEKCINSLFHFSKKYSLSLYVSDNGSTDDTIYIVKTKFPEVIVIQNSKNLGFGQGHNQILPFINQDYHFVINPDIYMECDVIGYLVDYLESNPHVGMVTPMIKNMNGSVQYLPKRNPTIRYLGLSKLPYLHYLRKEYTRENEHLIQPTEIEFCTGCFFCIRSSLFNAVNGFDNKYFMYFEDADLSRKIKENHTIIYYPLVSVYHEWHRENSKTFKGIKREIVSMYIYFNKWGWKL